MVLCTGGMSVDPDDQTPLAIKNTGAEIISYGAPVLPGAMFLLAYYGEQRIPVMGLPGCVMYSKRTIFDLVLPRIMADDPVTAENWHLWERADSVLDVKSVPIRTADLERDGRMKRKHMPAKFDLRLRVFSEERRLEKALPS